jgi:hypothetical protein
MPIPGKWKAFISRYDAKWSVSWDDSRDIPHRALLSGLRLAQSATESNIEEICRSFVSANEDLFGVKNADLSLSEKALRGKWYIIFDQTHDGVPVYGGRVHFRVATNGNLLLFGSECYPQVNANVTPSVSKEKAVQTAKESVDFKDGRDELVETKLVIYADQTVTPYRYYLTWAVRLRTKTPPGNWLAFVDAHSNEIIHSENQIRFDTVSGTVTGFILPKYYNDTPVEMPFACERVSIVAVGQNNTDVAGHYSINVAIPGKYVVDSKLSGPYAVVLWEDGAEAQHSDTAQSGVPHDWAWTAPDDGLLDEFTVYYHMIHVHDFIKGPPFYFNGMDYDMNATVRYGTNYDNAFYDGRDLSFGEGSNAPGGFRNLALFSDVIYHEYTHGIIDHINPTGSGAQFNAMHEGFADYMATTQNDDPYCGDGGLVFDGPYLRTLQNQNRFPEDFIGESHNDGLIIGGAMWDLRTYTGATLTDSLWIFALYALPELFEDYLTEVLVADDDNGNLGDGTPHACQIYLAFDNHGIGPGVAQIEHTPLKDTEDTLNPYPVIAKITSSMPIQDTIWLSYAVEPDTDFVTEAMDSTGNPDEFEAIIPAQSAGSVVHYYMSVLCVTNPKGAPTDTVYTFYVGADTVPPTIVHTPIPNMPYSAWPLTVIAEAKDNLALKSVTLEYKRNGAPQSPIPMLRMGGTDMYAADFTSLADTADMFNYRIIAVDSSAASNTAYEPPDQSYHSFEICAGFFDDMENGPGNWTHQSGGGAWIDQWHLSQTRNCNPLDSTSWKCGDTGGDTYANSNFSLLKTSPLNIESGSVMRFWHWMAAETLDAGQAWDGGLVQWSTDGGSTWPQLTPQGGYKFTIVDNPASPFNAGTPCFSGAFGWRMETFDLGGYSGTAQFRFVFGSDGFVGFEGWYMDEVSVYFCPEPGIEERTYPLGIPVSYGMSQPYPNPSPLGSSIRLQLPARARVELKVYDRAGRLVRNLMDGVEAPGYKTVLWDGRDSKKAVAPNGIYFFNLVCSESGKTVFSRTAKITLLRQ